VRPMPDAAPVMAATLLLNDFMALFQLQGAGLLY
jgi:hypothetical protein